MGVTYTQGYKSNFLKVANVALYIGLTTPIQVLRLLQAFQ